MYVTVWQMESWCQKSKGASLGVQTANPAICGHQKERLWGVGYSWGMWILHSVHFLSSCLFLCVTASLFQYDLLLTVPIRLPQYVICSCDLLVCACFAGDGRSRGAGLSHTAAGVLGRGVKLIGSPVFRKSKNPCTHHQTFQIFRLSGPQATCSLFFTDTF